jgi:hypothetical protein
MRAVTPNHVLRMYNLRAAFFLPALRDQVVCVIIGQIASEESITDRRAITLRRLCFILSEISQLYRDWIVVGRVIVAVITDVE